ncbi:hypothetical protein HBH70_144350 [Parastagonospora nodorum]|nr:hypothetical protein HBI10_197040 [Parastagonospora nodorum]KAH4012894.1 hypothetical protein HBI13_184250 [Parastagonospora nodorum]KAH4044774.1 hypothetical protein HBH49_212980 [Parastagonospora nodorum]KAH4064389.1 hypothetical protein HBH50_178530 [Parastagonospora nodorum]KAH4084189.1 hypothetical protein HBH48_165960 [Parastagonospora nodorum]
MRADTGASASVNDHPKIRSLLNRRGQMKQALPNATKESKYQMLSRRINQEKQRQQNALFQNIKQRWEYEQPVRDVERQLAGSKVEDNLEASGDMIPRRQRELVESVRS